MLVVLLIGSFLLNIAGIVFFILFLGARGNLRTVRNEKKVLERELALVRSAKVIADAVVSERILRRTFASQFDGEMDNYAFQPPSFRTGARDYTLVVYLHGMGSNYLEPFVTPNGATIATGLTRKDPGMAILSCNYRKNSWGSDAAVSDITQNIRLVMQEYPFSRIVIGGTSMGASVALTYAATCPKDIQEKVAGVLAFEGTGDLSRLYYETKNRDIAPAMIMAFGGRPDQIPEVYKRKGFLQNLVNLPRDVKVYVLAAMADRVVPFSHQLELVEKLKEAGWSKVKLVEVAGNHGSPSADNVAEALDYVLSKGP